MYHTILILFVVKTQATIQLGRISNANWILNSSQIDNTYINISNITCDQCLCQMFKMNNLTTSIACQKKWKICQLLFWNATAQLQTDITSIIYFQTIPNFLQTTINQQSLTTSVNSQSTETTANATLTTTMTVISNLLTNPGAESGVLSPWTPSSSIAPVVNNGMGSGGTTTIYNGSYAFYGGTGGGTLHQNVSLTKLFSTTQLDSGSLIASISFWEKSVGTSVSDTGQVNLIFLSATNTTISNSTTGPKACTAAWCHVTGNWSVPIGTRTIQSVMRFIVTTGSYADAWIDDISLTVA